MSSCTAGGDVTDEGMPWMRLAVAALQEGRCEEATRFARRLIQARQSDGDAWHLLGAALLTEGRWTAAHNEWRRGRQLAPTHEVTASIATPEIRRLLVPRHTDSWSTWPPPTTRPTGHRTTRVTTR